MVLEIADVKCVEIAYSKIGGGCASGLIGKHRHFVSSERLVATLQELKEDICLCYDPKNPCHNCMMLDSYFGVLLMPSSESGVNHNVRFAEKKEERK